MLSDNESDSSNVRLAQQLIGTWKSDPSDLAGIRAYGDLTLKFGTDGKLLCTVHEADRDQVMRLTFRVEPGFITTDQPSKPHAEKTRYLITTDGKLVLSFGSEESRFVRVTTPAPKPDPEADRKNKPKKPRKLQPGRTGGEIEEP